MSRYYNDPQEGLIPTSGYIIDTENQTTTFTSSDVANISDATSWTAVSKLDSGETQKSMFAKISQMFKNIRYLYKMLGTTDISTVGDGTVTGGLSNLKESLNGLTFKFLPVDATTNANGNIPLNDLPFGSLVVGICNIQGGQGYINYFVFNDSSNKMALACRDSGSFAPKANIPIKVNILYV